jgi:quinol-cytochrome oxidoreductase complex cytochrome b subunit
MSDTPDQAHLLWSEGDVHPFYPDHVLDQVMQLYLWMGLMVTLAVLMPMHLGDPADPLHTPEGIKPEWYFLPMYQGLKYVPELIGFGAMGVAALGFVLWPFVDGWLERSPSLARVHVWVCVVTLVFVLSLGTLGKVSGTTISVGGRQYDISARGVPHVHQEQSPPATPPAEGPTQ